MTGKELYDMFQKGIRPTLICTKKIDEAETQFEEGMLIDLINIESDRTDSDLIELTVDESNYVNFNKRLEKTIWKDLKTGIYDKKYSEIYKRKNTDIIFDYIGELTDIKIQEDGYTELQKEYINSNSDMSYNDWLQEEVLKLRELK